MVAAEQVVAMELKCEELGRAADDAEMASAVNVLSCLCWLRCYWWNVSCVDWRSSWSVCVPHLKCIARTMQKINMWSK